MNNIAKRSIGLTGGIATGKTTVSKYLTTKYHLPVLDADIYAREAVAKDSPILEAIFTRYGDRVMLSDRSLNRASLGEIVFNNPTEKQWLESQIHPYVRDRFEQELQRLPNTTIVLAIPLLFEAKLTDTVSEIWVVSCDRSLQIARLQQRNNLTIQQAEARIDSQMPLAEKIAAADVVLDNNADLAHLFAQVDRALRLTF
ncbi:MAG: dephospho-CoA kinase [Pleurocapsa sp. MO_226.B13]|nr:dephospho-CoA kinase [Pleurocapsa sp. MO_226.B13]